MVTIRSSAKFLKVFFFGMLVFFSKEVTGQETETSEIQGMQIVKIEGVYRYDSGGVPLLGYLKDRLPAKRVNFVVCSTAKIIPVDFDALIRVPEPCPQTPSIGTGFAWIFDSGKLKPLLVSPDQKDKPVYGTIEVNQLPKKFQSLVNASKQGEWAAYSFPSESGKATLGIIERPNM